MYAKVGRPRPKYQRNYKKRALTHLGYIFKNRQVKDCRNVNEMHARAALFIILQHLVWE